MPSLPLLSDEVDDADDGDSDDIYDNNDDDAPIKKSSWNMWWSMTTGQKQGGQTTRRLNGFQVTNTISFLLFLSAGVDDDYMMILVMTMMVGFESVVVRSKGWLHLKAHGHADLSRPAAGGVTGRPALLDGSGAQLRLPERSWRRVAAHFR